MKAHESDVLLVGSLQERRLYRQFTDRQVVSGASVMRLRGQRIRHAYATDTFWDHRDAYKVADTVKMYQEKQARFFPDFDLSIRHVSRWLDQHAMDEVASLRHHVSRELWRIENETGVQVSPRQLMEL